MAEAVGFDVSRENHIAAKLQRLDNGLAVALVSRGIDKDPGIAHQSDGPFMVDPPGMQDPLEWERGLSNHDCSKTSAPQLTHDVCQETIPFDISVHPSVCPLGHGNEINVP